MATTAPRTEPPRDLDAEIAALARPRAHELKVKGLSPFGRLYATPALHRLVPDRLAMRLAWAIGWLRWYWPPARKRAIGRVSLTVAGTPREGEARALARAELSIQAMRLELDWRPWTFENAPIEGIEHLERLRASGRPVLLTGAHIGGGWGQVLAHRSFPYAAASGRWLDPDSEVVLSGYNGHKARERRKWGEELGILFVPPGGSYEVLRRLLERGQTCLVMCDLPGRMRTRMAGKTAYLASGTARLAHDTGAAVVPVVGLLGRDGPDVKILEPIDPRSMDGPQAILDRLAAISGELMVRHPEQVEPLGFTHDAFKDDNEGYPFELWWPHCLRVRLAGHARGVARRLRAQLHG